MVSFLTLKLACHAFQTQEEQDNDTTAHLRNEPVHYYYYYHTMVMTGRI